MIIIKINNNFEMYTEIHEKSFSILFNKLIYLPDLIQKNCC